MPVVSMEAKYLRPARYDDLIEIKTRVRTINERAIVFESNIYNESRELLNRGIVKLCFLGKHTYQRVPTPAFIIQKIAEYPTKKQ